jgi:hypothetical protein
VRAERAYRLATDQGQWATQALAEMVLAFADRRTGALEEAAARLETLIESARRQQEPVLYLPVVLAELGFVRELQGDLEAALALHSESFRVAAEFDSLRGMCWALEGLAACHPDKALAATLLGAAAAARASAAYLTAATETEDLERARRAVDGHEAAYAVGQGLSPREAFELVLE